MTALERTLQSILDEVDGKADASMEPGDERYHSNDYGRIQMAADEAMVEAKRLVALLSESQRQNDCSALRVYAEGQERRWKWLLDNFDTFTAIYHNCASDADLERQVAEAVASIPTDARSCTCHPDDNPPKPCPRKFALDECRKAVEVDEISTQTAPTHEQVMEALQSFRSNRWVADTDGDPLGLYDMLPEGCNPAEVIEELATHLWEELPGDSAHQRSTSSDEAEVRLLGWSALDGPYDCMTWVGKDYNLKDAKADVREVLTALGLRPRTGDKS